MPGTSSISRAGASYSGQLVSVRANDAADGGGQIYLNGATGNRIDFNANGVAAPAFTTRSVGTRIVFSPAIGASSADYAMGINTNELWFGVADTSRQFRFYAGTTGIAKLSTNGLAVGAGIKSSHATQGIGYTTGAGGTVTQATSKSTAVTLNKATGEITMNGAALASGAIISFTLNNSSLVAADQLIVTHHSGGTVGSYHVEGRATGSGTGEITVRNLTAGSLSEAIVLKYSVINGATS